MRIRRRSALMEVIDALEPPAIGGAVVVDQAAAVVTEELAAAGDIREGFLDNGSSAGVDRHVDRKGSEAGMLRFLQEHGVLVPVLPAAVHAGASVAWALAE